MKHSKFNKSFNFGKEVLFYIRIFIINAARSNICLVPAVYDYVGFQQDITYRGSEFKWQKFQNEI